MCLWENFGHQLFCYPLQEATDEVIATFALQKGADDNSSNDGEEDIDSGRHLMSTESELAWIDPLIGFVHLQRLPLMHEPHLDAVHSVVLKFTA